MLIFDFCIRLVRIYAGRVRGYTILVPATAGEDALAVLSELPVEPTTEPQVWDFSPTKETKSGMRIYVWGILLVTAASIVIILFHHVESFIL